MKFFGTDGIRGKSEFFDDYFLTKTANAIVRLALGGRIYLARDTRVSGERISVKLIELLTDRGFDVVYLGITTTPVLAFMTAEKGGDLGIMISASHNPPEYNGLKFFSSDGKLSEEKERCFDNLISGSNQRTTAVKNKGKLFYEDGDAEYIAEMTSRLKPQLKKMKILLDTANGASSCIAPRLFRRLNQDITVINTDTDGSNINENCGATHIETLLAEMEKGDYDIGFSFDGDGDRVICAKEGKVYDGDHIIYLAARYFMEKGMLKENTVVGTVMTNFGTEKALLKKGIKLIRASVGDKYVKEIMKEKGYNVGGEASGHIIFSDYHNTGDGILSALIVCMIDSEKDISKLNEIAPAPQAHKDIITDKAGSFSTIKGLNEFIESLTDKNEERAVVRASGTEPKIRIMVEGYSPEAIANKAERIREFILRNL